MEAVVNLSRKEQVIRKAAELFREKGYAASSMRDLAQKLGIEAASLYSHIKSKEEILRSLCFDMAAEFRKSLEEVEKQGGSASEKLKKGIIGHISVMAKDLTASAVFMNEHRHLSQPYLRDFLCCASIISTALKISLSKGLNRANSRIISTRNLPS